MRRARVALASVACVVALGSLVGCRCDGGGRTTTSSSSSPTSSAPAPTPPSIDQALEGFAHDDPIAAEIETSEGVIHCTLDTMQSPRSVAMFVGLATGRAAWRDPKSGTNVKRPFYDGLSVFRAIPDLLVQTGCPIGDGTGHPGYRIELEPHTDDEARLARPGILLLASYNPPPNREDPSPPPPGHVIGSQIVITLGDMHHLAGKVTVIGSCRDLDVVSKVARLVGANERAVRIARVSFHSRDK